jgi:ubiquinone/menaquinone biosynthesis C-methylase UbiE
MSKRYDPNIIEGHFDSDPQSEWERMLNSPRNRVSFHIHKHYLQEYISKGNTVFEIGSGPGIYTVELAKLGAKIAVADLSTEILKLHKKKMKETNNEASILWRKKMDIVDLSEIPDDSFDASVAFGGPLSYVFDLAGDALAGLLRITKPGGYILLSVMSNLGTWKIFTLNVFDAIRNLGLPRLQKLFEDGDVTDKLAAKGTHHCHMFRWSELRGLLEKHPCELVVTSATGFMSNNLHIQERLEKEMKNQEVWDAFLQWELEFSREPGAIDAATHMIAIVQKRK